MNDSTPVQQEENIPEKIAMPEQSHAMYGEGMILTDEQSAFLEILPKVRGQKPQSDYELYLAGKAVALQSKDHHISVYTDMFDVKNIYGDVTVGEVFANMFPEKSE